MKNHSAALKPLFEEDNLRAIDAIDRAQLIAFAPYVWEATSLMIDRGILERVDAARKSGITLEEVAEGVALSKYGVRILLEAGLGIGVVYRKNNRYFLTKTGHMLLHHDMTKVNFNFMRDVCREGAPALEAAIRSEKPEGLKVFGNWPTIYEGLSQLPEQAKNSWFAFDHFYSDNTFPEILPLVFEKQPKNILDIGGNTGKWTLKCLAYEGSVRLGFVDLEGQIKEARKIIDAAGYSDRVTFYVLDMLQENELPSGYDTIWMSQFLDCFSDEEIVFILEKCYRIATSETRIFINETFWDRQRFETSAFALQMTSLYFTTMANGNSQMYDSQVFLNLVDRAGFAVVDQQDQIGLGHTLLELRKK